ncbi:MULTISPECIES: YchJ family protein [unclassified Nitratiruptor]|uniref:YchJ family protein n=1 Tax=unclassified Nitratiruptor TaxID=2624044 RepID=UPI001916A34D|nr:MULTISPECIES: YchJ family metal-binding protein [unclassified Nitratiruptor]BCD60424.1 hypothetical protein NitYY0810_C1189 [Nitratiruptor sp. YY08-10]BCD64087.1 SEC-C motif domain protein [Nitratiruptor sp. YY08-14]
MKSFANKPCPCGSKKKYKKCCMRLHKGKCAESAIELMKSRYSAYATKNYIYIVKTEYPSKQTNSEEIKKFCEYSFNKLEIIDFVQNDQEAFVEFKAYINDFILHERSRFVKEDGIWYYVDGVIFD